MKLCELFLEKNIKRSFKYSFDFLKNNLEKGVVYGKDTVNFIGNRIGMFFYA